MNVPTTVGNEVVNCTSSPCTGTLLGSPLIGASVLVGTDNVLLARGPIVTATGPAVPASRRRGAAARPTPPVLEW